MIKIQADLTPAALLPKIEKLWTASAAKIRSLEDAWEPGQRGDVIDGLLRALDR